MTPSEGLAQFDSLPEGLLDCPAQDLLRVLPGPTLIHLPGRLHPPLFVSVLLHGNETTGLQAVQRLLVKYASRSHLPRSLSLFFGNVLATAGGVRRYENQPDFNRIWPGTQHEAYPETLLMRTVRDEMIRRGVFASIDVHNNTGLNPHYACVNRLDKEFLWLASLFGRLVIYFTHPKGTQTAAFAPFCPAVTLECGKPEHPFGVEHAFEYLDACLRLSEIPGHALPQGTIDLYHTVAQLLVRRDCGFSFHDPDADLLLSQQLDHLNFTDLHPGIELGKVQAAYKGLPLLALDDAGRDVAEHYFVRQAGLLTLRKRAMPSMLTCDESIIRQDCLGYLMERLEQESLIGAMSQPPVGAISSL